MTKNIADSIKAQVGTKVLNKETTTELALTALLARGHVLLTGSTGLGKTQWAQAFAGALGVGYKRMRFTKDSNPHDIAHISDYEGRLGPMYSHVFHVDDIGSAHPHTHGALMDAMDQSKQGLSIEGLPEPFFIIATDSETRNLPEALADRFMMKLRILYPGVAAEKQLLQMCDKPVASQELQPVCTLEDLTQARQEVQGVAVDDEIIDFIIKIIETTRRVSAVQTGVSPRGSMALLQAAKAYAAVQGRDYVVPDDINGLATPVLWHRIILKPEAIKEGVQPDNVIESVLSGKG